MSLGNYDRLVISRIILELDAASSELMEGVNQERRLDIAGDLQGHATELELVLGTHPLNNVPQRSKTARRRSSSCARL